ncbi:MAG: hypothetical protein K2N37_09105 [Lachnospiraceae bacterium]|nr:hypothetical protein [Lachnospiraceae bacterium]
MEQYREQYREETAQVHAPIDLIKRTKAAVRAEEERILGERTIQPRVRQPKMTESRVTYADYAKYGKTFSLRKWTYPLTAAAALLILVSVSLTMRGLKSGDMAPAADTAYNEAAESGAIYEESAEFDAGFAEETAEAAMPMESAIEMAEEEDAGPERATGAAETESAAAEAPSEDRAPAINETQKAMSAADDTVQNGTSGAEESNTTKEEAKQNQETDREDSFADMATDKDSVIMERVEKKPAFCDLPDVKPYIYGEETFMVRKEKAGWVAYVETENGVGYLFRGEMEDVEEFLEAAYENLLKEK